MDEVHSAIQESNEALLEEMRPHLEWMKSLKSLVILFCHSRLYSRRVVDNFTRDFVLYWLPNRGSLLERLWVSPELGYHWMKMRYGQHGLISFMDSPVVKSAMMKNCLFVGPSSLSLLNDERFRFLEHLAHITFDYLNQGLDHLKELKYISGKSDHSKVLF